MEKQFSVFDGQKLKAAFYPTLIFLEHAISLLHSYSPAFM